MNFAGLNPERFYEDAINISLGFIKHFVQPGHTKSTLANLSTNTTTDSITHLQQPRLCVVGQLVAYFGSKLTIHHQSNNPSTYTA